MMERPSTVRPPDALTPIAHERGETKNKTSKPRKLATMKVPRPMGPENPMCFNKTKQEKSVVGGSPKGIKYPHPQ